MTKVKVVRFLDFFVAVKARKNKPYDRFYNGEEVSVGFGVSEDQMLDNFDERHYPGWEDDAPLDVIVFDNDDEIVRPEDIFDMSEEEEKPVDDILDVPNIEKENGNKSSSEEENSESYEEGDLLSSDENEKVYQDLYFNDVDEENPGVEFIDFEGFDHLFRNTSDIEMEDREKIYEPESNYSSTKNLSWSEVEWNDLKGPVPKYPSVVDPKSVLDLKKCYEIESYERVVGKNTWFFDYVDKFRKDTDSGSAYGYARIGDVLFKFKSPISSYWRPGKKQKQAVGVAECFISPIQRRGVNAYFLLPHDRLFSRVIDFDKKRENRIPFDLDVDLVRRYSMFAKTRFTQYYLGCTLYGLEKDAVVCVTLVPQGKMCDWEIYPYLMVTGSGKNGSMLDVGFPPFWNRPLKFDLVIKGDKGRIKIGGYVKFWLTHLVSGTQMWEPSVSGRVCGTELSGGLLGLVVNPVRTGERKYSSGFSRRGEDLRFGDYFTVWDFYDVFQKKEKRKRRVLLGDEGCGDCDKEDDDFLSTFRDLFFPT